MIRSDIKAKDKQRTERDPRKLTPTSFCKEVLCHLSEEIDSYNDLLYRSVGVGRVLEIRDGHGGLTPLHTTFVNSKHIKKPKDGLTIL